MDELQNVQRKNQLIRLYQEHNELLKQLVEMLKIRFHSIPVKRATADETMYELGRVEGMCEALDILLGEIERLAMYDKNP